jgi:hypothetical protein
MESWTGWLRVLFGSPEAAIEHPDDTVREALYPIVGEAILRDLVRRSDADEDAFRRRFAPCWRRHTRATTAACQPRRPLRCHPSAPRPRRSSPGFSAGSPSRSPVSTVPLGAASADGVRITSRRGEPWIGVPALTALPEPTHLVARKVKP